MRLAFVTIGDTHDIRRGSGTPYHLWKELERQGVTVHLVGPLEVQPPLLTRFFKWLSARMNKRYFSYRDPFMAWTLGREATRQLAKLDYDLILVNDYSLAGYTPTSKPIVLFTDDIFPFDYSANTHPTFANLSPFSVNFCQQTLQAGLRRASLCIFASASVMDEAKQFNLPGRERYQVIPYGANITPPAADVIRRKPLADQKPFIDLLFVGRDWERKGGEVAVKTVRVLNERGVPARLHVVGVDLSSQYKEPFVIFHGVLNKDNESESRQLAELYSSCDVLIVPSKAEGYGLAFVEAAAYGMPSLAYRSSGVMTAVREGVSGVLLPLDADETRFVSQIEAWRKAPQEYARLSKSAREYYEQTANWEVAVKTLLASIRSQGLAA